MESLLLTCLQPPQVRTPRVVRAELRQRLARQLDYRITVIAAPAGYGKTTLLVDWLAQNPHPVAWLSLAGDEEPLHFYRYLIATLRRHWPQLGQTALTLLAAAPTVRVATLCTQLINDMAELSAPITLVLDDYQLITHPDIHTGLRLLLAHAPPNFHLVISSRTQPPLGLAKWRAKGTLLAIGQHDLCFSAAEATTFLCNVMGRALLPAQSLALWQATEGWVTGLQLAALALPTKPDEISSAALVSGGHPYLADYLWTEVLQQQPVQVRTFLLQTALLDEFTAPLCDAVTQQGNAQAMITHLEEQNLFTVGLDHEHRWLRYHHLLRDYLRGALATEKASTIATCYQRAAHWFANAGQMERAIHYGLAAGDYSWVAQQIMAIGDRLWTHAEMQLLKRWTDALPGAVLDGQPKVALLRGWAAAILHDHATLLHAIQLAERVLQATPAAARQGGREQEDELLGILAILQSMQHQGHDPLHAISCYRLALTKLPAHLVTWQAAAYIGLGQVQHQLGELAAATQSFGAGSRACLATGNRYGAIYAQYQQGWLAVEQGLLGEATAIFTAAIAQATGPDPVGRPTAPIPIVAWPQFGMGAVLYEQNELTSASTYLLSAIQQARLIGEQEIVIRSQLLLGQIKVALQQWTQAATLIGEAQMLAYQSKARNAAALVTQTQLAQLRLALAQGQTDALEPWLTALAVRTALENWRQHAACLLLAQACWQRGQLAEAATRLNQLADLIPVTHGQNRLALYCLQALVADADKQPGAALALLDFPLRFAAAMGQRRLFLDYGQPLLPLLQRAALAYSSDSAVYRLCRTLERSLRATQPDIPAVGQALIEPLSAAELAILRLLALGLTNQQIADTRVTSVTTVKWHLKNIYGKLQVGNRTAAIARAQALALLQP